MLLTNLAILVLAGFVGFYVISKVPNTLHTPLMSGTNAIHGIVLLGGLLVLGLADNDTFNKIILVIAVAFGTINVVGGFLVTDRMLEMFKGKKPEIGRFKGLGEMMPAQLKETTMDPAKRTLARVTLPRAEEAVEDLVETLMGRKPELRFRFIQENAAFAVDDLDV